MKFANIIVLASATVAFAMPSHNSPSSSSDLLESSPTDEVETPWNVKVPEESCTTGEFQCYEDNIIQCAHEKWVGWRCMEGTRCVPKDYECVPLERYEEVWSQVNEQPTPVPTVSDELYSALETPTGSCELGQFACHTVGNQSAVAQCNYGEWVLWPCVKGTKCLESGDYECVQEERWNDVKSQIESLTTPTPAAESPVLQAPSTSETPC